jgi:co-chaperonin GroES (HSP10)
MYKIAQIEDESIVTQLPAPSGYHLLIAMPEVEEKTDGGVYLPDRLKEAEKTAAILGFVVKMGPDAYTDANKFPTGPWCKEGDFVVFRSYSGTRFKLRGKEFRLIDDETVEAVVDDPRGFSRA